MRSLQGASKREDEAIEMLRHSGPAGKRMAEAFYILSRCIEYCMELEEMFPEFRLAAKALEYSGEHGLDRDGVMSYLIFAACSGREEVRHWVRSRPGLLPEEREAIITHALRRTKLPPRKS